MTLDSEQRKRLRVERLNKRNFNQAFDNKILLDPESADWQKMEQLKNI